MTRCRMMGFECPAPHTVTRLRHCNSLLEEPLPNQGQEASPSPQRAGIMPYGGVPFDLLILRQPCCVVQAGLELLVLPSWLPEYQDYRHAPRPPAQLYLLLLRVSSGLILREEGLEAVRGVRLWNYPWEHLRGPTVSQGQLPAAVCRAAFVLSHVLCNLPPS